MGLRTMAEDNEKYILVCALIDANDETKYRQGCSEDVFISVKIVTFD